jgi:DNA-binding CsgD family transcriptional regulator
MEKVDDRPLPTPALVEKVAQEVAALLPSPVIRRPAGTVEELLLEGEVEGAHYLILRSHTPASDTPLSPRELEIARLVAKGLPNKAIAAVLDISMWTVSAHLRRIFAKLNVSSRAAMVAQLMNVRMVADAVEHESPPAAPPRVPRR